MSRTFYYNRQRDCYVERDPTWRVIYPPSRLKSSNSGVRGGKADRHVTPSISCKKPKETKK